MENKIKSQKHAKITGTIQNLTLEAPSHEERGFLFITLSENKRQHEC